MRTFGRYRLVELLASGGMADVWRAEVSGAAGVVREVALKLVRGEHEASSDFVKMFVEEARLASRLTHANIVQVHDFDEVGGRYYIAMELVRGHHLGRVVERARERGLPLGLPRAVNIVAEVAKGLAHAHRASEGGRPLGIVHRDVSPHNVLVSFEGEVKLADFGIARAAGQVGLTEPGTVKGKLAYMPPEQALGGAVDARADLYALGVVLWELCAGRRLFARDTEAATWAAVTSAEPVSPASAWNEAVPPRLDALLAALLERVPARRLASADEAAAALSGILLEVTRAHDEVDLRAFMARLWPEGWRPASAPEPTRVRPPGAGGAAASRAGDPSAERETRTSAATAGRRRRAAVAAAAAVLLLGVGGAVGYGILRSSPRVEPPAAVDAPRPPAPAPSASPDPALASAPSPPAAPEAGLSPDVNNVGAPPASTSGAEPARRRPPRAPAAPRGRAAVLARESPLDRLPLPDRSSGEGILQMNAIPWGSALLDGDPLGDTPLEVRVRAGSYRVRLVGPKDSTLREGLVSVEPGKKLLFQNSAP